MKINNNKTKILDIDDSQKMYEWITLNKGSTGELDKLSINPIMNKGRVVCETKPPEPQLIDRNQIDSGSNA